MIYLPVRKEVIFTSHLKPKSYEKLNHMKAEFKLKLWKLKNQLAFRVAGRESRQRLEHSNKGITATQTVTAITVLKEWV